MKKLNFILLFLLTLSAGFLLNNQKSLAVSGADWKPGRIIDDVVFQNKQSMTVQQIQQFLDSKVPTCDRWGTLPMWAGGPSRAQWSADNGKDLAPYTCLKEYVENPITKANNGADPTIAVPGGLSAAQLIYNAAQAQSINPQVFLVLLQKEQSLVTDDWPYAKQFERATGNNCPDTAPCDPAYAWLSTQVNNAGAQFNYYVNHFDQYNYAPGWNNILYNPNAACGRQSVFIENRFTAALYIYTPYVPNQAALNNMYGTGDSCSAYGNRNFWRLFNDWFGSSIGAPYDYQYLSSTPFGLQLEYAQTYTATVRLTNQGTNIWYADGSTPSGSSPVRLITRGYQLIEFADMSDPNWLSPAQIRMSTPVVAPGETATFTFRLKAPAAKITREYYILPVVDGVGGMKDIGMLLTLASSPPSYVAAGPIDLGILNLLPNTTSTQSISIKNTGIATWYADGSNSAGVPAVRLVSSNYQLIEFADMSDPNWLSPAQIRMSTPVVAPGETATFTFRLKAPAAKKVGHYYSLVPIFDGVGGMQGQQAKMTINVASPLMNATVMSVELAGYMQKASTQTARVSIRNDGNITWRNESTKSIFGPTRLARVMPSYASSALYDPSSWLSSSQIAMKEPEVKPGEIATFEFTLKSPPNAGTYYEPFGIVVDGYYASGTPIFAPLFTIK